MSHSSWCMPNQLFASLANNNRWAQVSPQSVCVRFSSDASVRSSYSRFVTGFCSCSTWELPLVTDSGIGANCWSLVWSDEHNDHRLIFVSVSLMRTVAYKDSNCFTLWSSRQLMRRWYAVIYACVRLKINIWFTHFPFDFNLPTYYNAFLSQCFNINVRVCLPINEIASHQTFNRDCENVAQIQSVNKVNQQKKVNKVIHCSSVLISVSIY